jgi:hypothetical protein
MLQVPTILEKSKKAEELKKVLDARELVAR